MKKLFISADIEGTCGIAAWEETDAAGRNYAYFCERMTAEVDAAVRGAEQAGFVSTVKDAHDSARNINPMGLPKSATLIRGWAKDCYCMMGGWIGRSSTLWPSRDTTPRPSTAATPCPTP